MTGAVECVHGRIAATWNSPLTGGWRAGACLVVTLLLTSVVVGRSAWAGKPAQHLISTAAQARLASAIESLARQPNRQLTRIPLGRLIEAGDSDERIGLIRQRLSGADRAKKSSGQSASNRYDPALVSQVRKFQARHGLLPDGRIGNSTIKAINLSRGDRIRILRTNLARLKRLRRQITARRYVLVNLPALTLVAVRDNVVELDSTVIVGRRDRPTPTMNAMIRAVNIHPAWHVPASIVRSDLYAKLAQDPAYFRRRNIQIFDGADPNPISAEQVVRRRLSASRLRLVQQPGPKNALGRIRIDMPNAQSIFLHDTPVPRLFGWPGRLFSSGCVRVARIVELAAWLSGTGTGADLTLISQALRQPKSRTIKLPTPVPVHLVYLTAWVDADGQVQFRPDIYGRDQSLQK